MRYKIKSRIWIESGKHVLLGEGKVQLLKAIEKTGSLSKAAKDTNMSYKKAWNLLKNINKSAKKPIITTSIGGKNGGGSKLTDYGKKLVYHFEKINKECWEYLDLKLEQLDKL